MPSLTSFEKPVDALIAGANGGIGHALVDALLENDNVRSIHALSRSSWPGKHKKIISHILEVGDETEILSSLANINRLTLVIVTTGMLHDKCFSPEKSYKSISPLHMAESFYVNVILPTMIAKHIMAKIPREERAIFCALSARVGSISDNRLGGWYSYRAGKAALNQILKCLSIEIKRTHPKAVCVGLHPGTVNTKLSLPFQKSMAPHHKLLLPSESANHLLNVIDRVNLEDSGFVFAWDGTIIPP